MTEIIDDNKTDWRVLFPLIAAAFASAMSMTIMPVAVPAVSQQFSLSQDQVHWISTGFMAAMTFAMLLTPWLIDCFGFRRSYEGSLCVLLAGAVCASLAASFPFLVVARIAEGLAAGVLQPLPVIVVSLAFGDGKRGRAMGLFTLGTVLAPAISPFVGGVLIEFFGWRFVPLALTPFCLLALLMGRRLAPYRQHGECMLLPERKVLDGVGLGLSGIALFGMLAGLSQWRAGGGWTTTVIIAISLLAGTALPHHLRQMKQPLLSTDVFHHRGFVLTCAVAFAYGVGMFGSAYLIPVFVQQALQRSPVEAGAMMLPAGLLLAVSSPFGGWLADRLAAHRVIAAGMALLAIAFMGLLAVHVDSPLSLLMALLLVSRFGMALVLPSLNLSALKSLPRALWTDGSTAINLIRQLGASLGVSAVAVFLQWRLERTQLVKASTTTLATSAFHETFVLISLIAAVGALVALTARRSD